MDRRALLEAITAGHVTRVGGVQGASYLLDATVITRLELTWLAKADLIDLPIGGPPRIAPAGERWLREHPASDL